ncbi:MAG: gas vesicle protein K [Chloroflexi bacterium]|nr:gas vesicle protein K [Chloroflexota bacterium]
MLIDLDQEDLKGAILGLVLALVEIIEETLRLQALKRMAAGSLTEREVERLGVALMELESALDRIKVEMGVTQSVKAFRDGLDQAIADLVNNVLEPGLPAETPTGGLTQ